MKRAAKTICTILFAALATPAVLVANAGDLPVTAAPRASAPTQSGLGWTSGNWAGYAVTGQSYTSVSARWKVPKVVVPKNTRKNTYSLSWVGIDGFKNSSLIQAGTEQDWYLGKPFYRAWWEILPAPETPISAVGVHPGDVMSVSISAGASSTWTITVTNTTTHQTFTTVQTYSGPGQSAEWIHEAPLVGTKIAPLTKTTKYAFDNATVNGANPSLTPADAGHMVKGARTIAIPSAPDSDGDGFAIAFGAIAPKPPAS
jgi:hypothetical protein